MSRLVAFDFETYWDSKSKYSLKSMGPISYVRDPRFEPLCVALATERGSSSFDLTSPCIPQITMFERACGNVLVGHNAHGFDALILSEHYGLRAPHVWDTIAMMHWTGLSRIISCSHEALTKFLGNGTKEAGTVLSDGRHVGDFTEDQWDWFLEYCRADASQCRANAVAMLPYMTPDACRFMSLTARMATEPMFVLDEDRLREFIADLDKAESNAFADIARTLGVPNDRDAIRKAIRSAERMATMLRSLGVEPPMKKSEKRSQRMGQDVMVYAFAKTDLEFRALLNHDDPRVRALVATRLEFNGSTHRARAERLMQFVGKSLPVMLSCFKAHTSRYTAGANEGGSTDGLQFQNLSKRDPSKKKLRQAIRAPEGHVVVACDSSQIEARVLAWLAGQNDLVEQFRQGRDPYAELAGRIFNLDHAAIHDGAKGGDPKMKLYRNVGKTCVLSAGYGVGRDRFSDTLLRQGMALDEQPIRHRELAYQAHATYRNVNVRIVEFWRTCGYVLEAMRIGCEGSFGGPDNAFFSFGPMPILSESDLIEVPIVPSIALPSGFKLRYPNLRLVDGEYFYDRPAGMASDGTTKLVPVKIYGAALCENLCQSLAFQLLMWQACRLDEIGVRLHANVHDSFASVVLEEEAEETLAVMKMVMSAVPDWMRGFPVACEGEIGTDFTVV